MNTKVTQTYEQRRRGWAVQTLRGFHFTDEAFIERFEETYTFSTVKRMFKLAKSYL